MPGLREVSGDRPTFPCNKAHFERGMVRYDARSLRVEKDKGSVSPLSPGRITLPFTVHPQAQEVDRVRYRLCHCRLAAARIGLVVAGSADTSTPT